MTLQSDSHHRPSSQHKKKHSSNRPALLTRSQSENKFKIEISQGDDQDDIMASGFLQFCATCEKQVPSNATLYCSERCRQKDNVTALTYPLFKSDISSPSTPLHTSPFEHPLSSPDIVPPRSPTAYRNSQPYFPGFHVDPSSPTGEATRDVATPRRPSPDRSESEAARYLRQFGSGDRSSFGPRPGRTSPNTSAAPSLSTTPASSYSASTANTPSSFQTRPLPPRGNPRGTSISFSSRSIDLVTPIPFISTGESSLDSTGGDSDRTITSPKQMSPSSTTTSFVKTSGELLSYEKRPTIASYEASPGHSSLKQLLASDDKR